MISDVCPICMEPDNNNYLNIHVKTKYDESIFGIFILQDPSAKFALIKVGEWIERILGPTTVLCLQEKYDGDVVIHGVMTPFMSRDDEPFHWQRSSTPIVLIQILKDENLFNILLDPSLME